uniref:Demethylmenaquinone methyltransferase n=1 Tax=Desulfomonile tiedjei TaxID=2358 RepID=A0A7C4EYJ3_9BACT
MNQKPIETWTEAERIAVVKRIFNTVTDHYDLLNRLMSARRDVWWRRFTVRRIPKEARLVLDVATGTGDLAIEIAASREAQVVGADFVPKMMAAAKEKTSRHDLCERISYVAADANQLPFPSGLFDAAAIAFGLRNIPTPETALTEMARVVKPGGKVMVLEMTFPRNMKLRWFFQWYLNNVIPFVGRMISGDAGAYRYLPDSIQHFLHPDELTSLYQQIGLRSVKAFPLTFGLTYLHEGVVP